MCDASRVEMYKGQQAAFADAKRCILRTLYIPQVILVDLEV
jgi:hypothetical protein